MVQLQSAQPSTNSFTDPLQILTVENFRSNEKNVHNVTSYLWQIWLEICTQNYLQNYNINLTTIHFTQDISNQQHNLSLRIVTLE